jgi:hypothetical protein
MITCPIRFFFAESVAEWLERLRCDHSEAVWAGSKPGACDCKESSVLGKKHALTGASGFREMQSDLHRLAPGRSATFPAYVSGDTR